MSVVVQDGTYDYATAAEAVLVALDDAGDNTWNGNAADVETVLRGFVYLAWQQAIQDPTIGLLSSDARLAIGTAVQQFTGVSESAQEVEAVINAMVTAGQQGGNIDSRIWNAVAEQANAPAVAAQQDALEAAHPTKGFGPALKRVTGAIGDGIKAATSDFLDWLGISPTVLIVAAILFFLLIAVLIANNFKPRRA